MAVQSLKAVKLNHDIEKQISLLLGDKGYEDIVSAAYPSFSGRNNSWIIEFSSNHKVFVKKIDPVIAGEKSFTRSVSFSRFTEKNGVHAPNTPRLIAEDSLSGLLVFEVCDGENLAQLLIDEKVPQNFSSQVGEQLAHLHAGPVTDLEAITPPSPPEYMFEEGVPYQRYIQFSLAELSLWKQLQEDEELVQKIVELRKTERDYLSAPVHGDLRLDQFQMHRGQPAVLDWEEFGKGDPARDLGTFAGEWIYRAVLDSVTTRGGFSQPPDEFNAVVANERIANRFLFMIPQIKMMWAAYCDTFDRTIDSDLSRRAVAYLGWHLIDRTLARAPHVAKLPAVERAAAGIGRKILLSPEAYIDQLGFERRT